MIESADKDKAITSMQLEDITRKAEESSKDFIKDFIGDRIMSPRSTVHLVNFSLQIPRIRTQRIWRLKMTWWRRRPWIFVEMIWKTRLGIAISFGRSFNGSRTSTYMTRIFMPITSTMLVNWRRWLEIQSRIVGRYSRRVFSGKMMERIRYFEILETLKKLSVELKK